MKIAELSPVMKETFRFNESDSIESFEIEQFPTIISETDVDTSRIQLLNDVTLELESRILRLLLDEKTQYGDKELIECYIPKHVLLFYDQQDSIIGITEICFECEKLKTFGVCENWTFDVRREDYIELENIFDEITKE